ncbi:crocetin glucosyltransferase, chloroplastic-like [Neltuma alba]|uniref:crocetin glucosyltransferase, chloroplastic-like n=1 Tax=Neltuma alba TaxID=207710 RepID=UPI0010A2C673|nr:crocetin glucosyltransferase, chloroplastic-like [Prosopis alba]
MVHHHFLILAFPAQGHINPALQLAHRLIRMGVLVTLSTTVRMHRRMDKTSTNIPGLSFAPFSDGFDDGYKPEEGSDDLKASAEHYMSEFRRRGSESLADLIVSSKQNGGHPFTCIVHTMLLPWTTELARQFHLPSALLWVQPATLFDIFYYYFKDDNLIKNKLSSASNSIELPGLPPLEPPELPSFITCLSGTYAFVLPLMGEELRILQQEANPTVLLNTFEELEADALRVLDDSFRAIAVGPLVPSILLDGENLWDTRNDYMEWLSSKPESSVIYISFGSLCVLPKRQMEEIARGLIDSGRPFLWSIREEEEQEKVSEYAEEMEEKGKIVRWCKQAEILSHKSVGCFVSHCGWNSSLESLVAGVPVVGIPQWADQTTNAKLIEQVWKTGVKVRVTKEEDGAGIARGEEIRRCVEEVMGNGERGKEVKKKAAEWGEVSREAGKAGGSSDSRLRALLDELVSAPNN